MRVAPSILSADFAKLAGDIGRVADQADALHVDVMDGHFVPNLTIGPPVVQAIRRHTDLYLDCHLMMTNPGSYLDRFKEAGADHCTVHVEVGDTGEHIEQMRELGLGVGLAVNPETPFSAAEEWLGRIDLLLLMTVHPGFGGQSFIGEVLPKIEQAARAVGSSGLEVTIEVDGGIDATTAPLVAKAGATMLVAGNAIFGEPDPGAATTRLKAIAEEAAA